MNSKATSAARIVLGLIFFVFGLNGFLHFAPPPPFTPAAASFESALFATGYFWPLLKATEVLSSVALLSRRFVPLALTVLAPIIVNIVACHLFLAPVGLPIAIPVLALEVFLAWSYRSAFRTVLRARDDLAPAAREPAHRAPSDARAS